MSLKRIFGIILVVAGVGFIYLSHYINGQVGEGWAKISSAQKATDTTGSLFSIIPGGNVVGKQMTGSAQSQINEGTAEANQYSTYATWSMIGGIAFIVVGIGFVVLGKRKTHD